jgi:hypothetical protein
MRGAIMTPGEAERVSINHCLRDDELEIFEGLADRAEPGAWVVREGRVVRYGGEELARKDSLLFIAAARGAVPRLVRGVRALETALRTAWAEATSWKRSVIAEREQHEAALARAADGKTGPIEDLEILIELAELGAERRGILVREIQRWAAGLARHPGVYAHNVELARSRARLDDESRKSVAREVETLGRQCRALIEELELTKKERKAAIDRATARAAGGTS